MAHERTEISVKVASVLRSMQRSPYQNQESTFREESRVVHSAQQRNELSIFKWVFWFVSLHLGFWRVGAIPGSVQGLPLVLHLGITSGGTQGTL